MRKQTLYRLDTHQWTVERTVFLIAGIFVATLTLLSLFVHPGFRYAVLFVGGMLIFFALTGYCPMAMLVARLLDHRRPNKHG